MVFAPAPELTVTIERRGDSSDIHLHPGGQGVWQARMVASLGVPVVLCASFGGEVGQVLKPLITAEGIDVRATSGASRNGAYVHDRRKGMRVDIADVPADPLSRHELDELYGMALAEGLRAEVCVLSGPTGPGVVPPETYRRLASDLGRNGSRVLADLSGDYLSAVLGGKPRFVKVSHEDLGGDNRIESLIESICALRDGGADTVVLTRAERPALALVGDTVYEVVTPRMEAADPRGAGDSLTAGMAATLAQGASTIDAIRSGAAAGALNVTRHGLGTGEPEAVMQLRKRVRLVPVRTTGPAAEDRTEAPDIQATPQDLAERVRPE
jgi:1-phosphofructokinase